MKRIVTGAALALLMSAPAFARPHPNLKEAYEHLQKAKEAMERAIKAHEYDKGRMGGHGGEAVEKINEAEKQVREAHEFLESQQ
jgi:cellobiose-specific phosphotransferase system component IIA